MLVVSSTLISSSAPADNPLKKHRYLLVLSCKLVPTGHMVGEGKGETICSRDYSFLLIHSSACLILGAASVSTSSTTLLTLSISSVVRKGPPYSPTQITAPLPREYHISPNHRICPKQANHISPKITSYHLPNCLVPPSPLNPFYLPP